MGWAGVAKAVMALGAASSARDSNIARKDQKREIDRQKTESANAKQEAESAAAAEAERKRRENLQRQGMMSTVKTSPLGAIGQAQTAKKTLLGQ